MQTVVLLYVISLVALSTAQFSVSTPSALLPRNADAMAAGYYNNTIHLFGGNDYPFQYVQYKIHSDVMIDKGTTFASYPASTVSTQHFSQIGDKLFWINSARIYSYNFANQIFNSEASHSVQSSCMTSLDELLFNIGGFWTNALSTVAAFNTTSAQWITDVSDLVDPRYLLACAVDPTRGKVYAIGGRVGLNHNAAANYATLSVETDKSALTSATWQDGSDSLDKGLWGYRAVYVASYDSILVISDDIQRIRCSSGRVELVVSSTQLDYNALATTPIFAEHRLFIFNAHGSDDKTWRLITNPDDFGFETDGPTVGPTMDLPIEHNELVLAGVVASGIVCLVCMLFMGCLLCKWVSRRKARKRKPELQSEAGRSVAPLPVQLDPRYKMQMVSGQYAYGYVASTEQRAAPTHTINVSPVINISPHIHLVVHKDGGVHVQDGNGNNVGSENIRVEEVNNGENGEEEIILPENGCSFVRIVEGSGAIPLSPSEDQGLWGNKQQHIQATSCGETTGTPLW